MAKPGKAARPTRYSKRLVDAICSEIIAGKTVREILDGDASLPHRATFYRWLALPSMQYLRDQYARACELRADAYADEMIYIAKTPEVGEVTINKESDTGYETTTRREDMLGHRRLIVDTLKWNTARMNPKKYGKRLDVTSGDEPIESAPIMVFNMRPADQANADKKRD